MHIILKIMAHLKKLLFLTSLFVKIHVCEKHASFEIAALFTLPWMWMKNRSNFKTNMFSLKWVRSYITLESSWIFKSILKSQIQDFYTTFPTSS